MSRNGLTADGFSTIGNIMTSSASANTSKTEAFELPVDVKTAARFLGVSPSLVYAYVERKQIPHFRMMGRAIRFRLSELEPWRQQFHVNGGIKG
jgi:excisionase family DNA binding protein